MDIEAALELAKGLISAHTNKHLSDLQIYVLKGALEGKTLSKIAEFHSYNESHVKEVSTNLCKLLSVTLGEPICKKNLRSILEQHLHLEEQKLESLSLFAEALNEVRSCNKSSNKQGVENISLLGLGGNDNKDQRGMWIPNLRCRKVWGRDNFTAEILQRLQDPQVSILSLCGSAGYGKTEVAREVAWAAIDQHLFADVLWVKARDTEFLDGQISQSERNEVLSWQQLLQEIAHQLEGCSVKRVYDRLKEEKRLIVLDNAETAQLNDILPELNKMLNPSRVLLTSRLQTSAPYVGLINIPPLEEEYSYQLLQSEAKYKNVPALLQANPDQLQQVYKLSCGAPLALHFIIGRVLDDGTLEPVLSALEQASGDVEKIYEFSLTTSWQRISEATKNVLRYMGACDAGVTWEELLGARQIQEADWNLAQRELKRWYLMESQKDAQDKLRYNLHPWVRRSLRRGLVDKWQRSIQEWEQIAKWKYDLN